MMSLRNILAGAALALALLPAGAFADTDTTELVLAADDCSNGPWRLAYAPGAKSGCNKGSTGNWTGSPTSVDFPAVDALPLTLDPSRKVHVTIAVGTFLGLPAGDAIGNETVRVTLSGKKAGSSNAVVTLGSATATMAAADRAQTETAVYELDIQPAADKAGVYKALTLNESVSGSVLSGYVNFDGTSLVSFPIIDGTEPVPPEDE